MHLTQESTKLILTYLHKNNNMRTIQIMIR